MRMTLSQTGTDDPGRADAARTYPDLDDVGACCDEHLDSFTSYNIAPDGGHVWPSLFMARTASTTPWV